MSEWFEIVVSSGRTFGTAAGTSRAKLASNWIQTEVFRLMKANGIPNDEIGTIKVKPQQLAELSGLVEGGAINNNTAKAVFEDMFATGADATAIVEAKCLAQVSDTSVLQQIGDDVLAANPQQVAQVLAGQDKLFGFLVGQAMKATKCKGNATVISTLLREGLEKRGQ